MSRRRSQAATPPAAVKRSDDYGVYAKSKQSIIRDDLKTSSAPLDGQLTSAMSTEEDENCQTNFVDVSSDCDGDSSDSSELVPLQTKVTTDDMFNGRFDALLDSILEDYGEELLNFKIKQRLHVKKAALSTKTPVLKKKK